MRGVFVFEAPLKNIKLLKNPTNFQLSESLIFTAIIRTCGVTNLIYTIISLLTLVVLAGDLALTKGWCWGLICCLRKVSFLRRRRLPAPVRISLSRASGCALNDALRHMSAMSHGASRPCVFGSSVDWLRASASCGSRCSGLIHIIAISWDPSDSWPNKLILHGSLSLRLKS